MKLLYKSKKHCFNLWKEGRTVHFDHPLADKQDILMSANLDSEAEMDRFKAAINSMINLHNECKINYTTEVV